MGLTFNGSACNTVGLEVIDTRRAIMSESKDTYIYIPGKSGSIHIPDNTFEDVIIEVDFMLEKPNGVTFMAACRSVGAWLSTTSRVPLVFDDDPSYTYSAKVESGVPTIERIAHYGIFTVSFRALPYEVT